MYSYVCVCICVCIYVRTHARVYSCVCIRTRINSITSPASGAGKVSGPRLMSQVGRLPRSLARVDQCVPAVRAVVVPLLVCLRSSCSHVTEVGGA